MSSVSVPSLDHLFHADYRKWKRGVSPRRAYNILHCWQRNFTGTEIAECPVNFITEDMAIDFFDELKEVLGWEVRRTMLQRCKKLEKQAIRKGYRRTPVFTEVKVPQERQRRVKFWHPISEVPKLLHHSPSLYYKDAYGCMYYGFMRKSDVRHLDCETIDWHMDTVTFLEDYTKSGRQETIPLNDPLRDILQRRFNEVKGEGLLFPSARTQDKYHWGYEWRMEDTAKAANIPRRGRLCHAWRHSAAVSAASGLWGRPWEPGEIAEMLRDSSPRAVMVYYKVLGSRIREKANQIRQVDSYTPES